jgi:S1-C subfamily serine protease
MKRTFILAALAVACLAFSIPATGAEESLPAATKRIFNEHKDSVVWVSVVAKMTFSASESKSPINIPEREQKFEALGTVLDAKGLVVTALSAIDPTKELSGREVNTPSGRIKIEASSTMKEVHLTMPDGTEVPADLVMKDLDLDLAFIKPKADSKELKGVQFKPIDLKNSTAGAIADDTVTVLRMDETLNRQPGVQGGQVIGVTQKPRNFLRVSGTALGCPTFSMDGKLMGINVTRSAKERMAVIVVLPSADVLEVAEQAKNAKPISTEETKAKDEKKDEEKK